jgi:hypothetical protein
MPTVLPISKWSCADSENLDRLWQTLLHW